MIRPSSYRSGTLLVSRISDPSLGHTTEALLEHCLFTISRGNCFSTFRRDTFTHIKTWLEEVKNNGNPHMEILLVGNKNDLEEERVVSFEEGEKMAQENGLTFI